jgi:hypothetical protein
MLERKQIPINDFPHRSSTRWVDTRKESGGCEEWRPGARAKQRQVPFPRLNIHAPFEYIRERVQRARAEISQRDGFTEDRLADQRAKRAANHHLHRPLKQLLQICGQTTREPWRCLSGDVDKEVTSLSGVSSPRATVPKRRKFPAP